MRTAFRTVCLCAALTALASCATPPKPQRPKIELQQVSRRTDVPGMFQYDIDKIHLLSLYIGAIGPAETPKPAGFELGPGDVDFIYGSLMGKAWRWGASAMGYLYYDDTSYYVSKLWPDPAQPESARPMLLHATQINGRDGRVFNHDTGEWEHWGYIHLTKRQVKWRVRTGSSVDDVIRTLGQCFEGTRMDFTQGKTFELDGQGKVVRGGPMEFPKNDANQGHVITQLHYWTKEGEVVVTLRDDKVTGVVTDVVITRQ